MKTINPAKTIMLINPQIGLTPPFGLLYLAAALEKAGHNVEVRELDSYHKEGFDPEKQGLVKEIIDKKPDLIGITCLSAYAKIVKNLIAALKKEGRNIPVIVGGPHATALPETMLNAGADIVVIGEGESRILEILDYYKGMRKIEEIEGIAYPDNNRTIKINPKRDYENVANIPLPAYHLINLESYLARNFLIRGYWLKVGWVFTARGCPGRCTFCASYLTHGNGIRERAIDDVIAELKFLKQRYKIEGFWILDDTFPIKAGRVKEFCAKFRESGLKLKWGCQSRVNYFTEEKAEELKKSGCLQVDFGVESGSQRVLDYLKKDIKVEQTKKAFQICKKYKLRALATCMIGTPYETKEDIEKTKQLLNEIKPDVTGIFFTTPYPGTELYKEAIDKKLADLSGDVNWEHTSTPIFQTNFTLEELHKICNELIKNNFRKTLLEYIAQPLFLYDSMTALLMNPGDSLRLLIFMFTGKREDFINKIREMKIKRRI